jgi:hypothetical protein
VQLGNYRLNTSQCKRLGKASTPIEWNEDDEEALENTVPALHNKGYSSFKTQG